MATKQRNSMLRVSKRITLVTATALALSLPGLRAQENLVPDKTNEEERSPVAAILGGGITVVGIAAVIVGGFRKNKGDEY